MTCKITICKLKFLIFLYSYWFYFKNIKLCDLEIGQGYTDRISGSDHTCCQNTKCSRNEDRETVDDNCGQYDDYVHFIENNSQ